MTSESHDKSLWIVGVDGSDAAKSAARWAVANAASRAESVCLVQVWNSAATFDLAPFEPAILAKDQRASEQEAQDELALFAAELTAASTVPLTSVMVRGDPSTVLLDRSSAATLLVMGARGAGRFDRLLLGSTSTRCATHATVPTVVIRQHFEQPPPAAQHLVVGFDGSDNAMEALDWACTFAVPGSTVDIVGAWEFTPSLFSGEPFYYPDAAKRARQHFDDQLTNLSGSAQRDDITVNTRFVRGRPRNALATCASEADLLVVGARGRGAIGAALLGSVSTWLLHHFDRPIAVVP